MRKGLVVCGILTVCLLSAPLFAGEQASVPDQLSKNILVSKRHVLVDQSGLRIAHLIRHVLDGSSDEGIRLSRDEPSILPSFTTQIWTNPHSGSIGMNAVISF